MRSSSGGAPAVTCELHGLTSRWIRADPHVGAVEREEHAEAQRSKDREVPSTAAARGTPGDERAPEVEVDDVEAVGGLADRGPDGAWVGGVAQDAVRGARRPPAPPPTARRGARDAAARPPRRPPGRRRCGAHGGSARGGPAAPAWTAVYRGPGAAGGGRPAGERVRPGASRWRRSPGPGADDGPVAEVANLVGRQDLGVHARRVGIEAPAERPVPEVRHVADDLGHVGREREVLAASRWSSGPLENSHTLRAFRASRWWPRNRLASRCQWAA